MIVPTGSPKKVAVTLGAAVPIELGVIDRTVAGVHHGHDGAVRLWFVVFLREGNPLLL